MKILICILVILFVNQTYSQNPRKNFNSIDRRVLTIETDDMDELAQQLLLPEYSNLEKVRAIFRWITAHIDYRIRAYRKKVKNFVPQFVEDEEDTTALPSLDERVGVKVLRFGTAFCESYSRLFKALCDRGGIPCEVIHGYARTGFNQRGRFGNNHTWNTVFVDHSWQLLDVTWASGFLTFSNQFIRRFDESYFLTPPWQFIRDHYPEDLRWTLLDQPPVYSEFKHSPFRYAGFIKSGITAFFPAKGIIETEPGDSVVLILQADRPIRNLVVSETLLDDSLFVCSQNTAAGAPPAASVTYHFSSLVGDWLYVYNDEELVMRYKLKRRTDVAITE